MPSFNQDTPRGVVQKVLLHWMGCNTQQSIASTLVGSLLVVRLLVVRLLVASLLLIGFLTGAAAQAPLEVSSATPSATPSAIAPTAHTAHVPPLLTAPHWVLSHWQPGAAPALVASVAADSPAHPASITKLLTAYVVMQAVAKNEITLNSLLTVSALAAAQDGSRVGYRVGEQVVVHDALQGMLAISGNDAALALAQHVGGSAEAFVARMNAASSALGLTHSRWQNPHGLTDAQHTSSARDLALLAHALWTQFPQVRPWLGVKTYTWNGVTQSNRNSLLWRDATVDGLKTGRTDAAGYNLAASSVWRVTVAGDTYDWRLASVVLGAPSAASRASDTAALLAWGRSAYVPWRLYAAGQFAGVLTVAGAVGQQVAHLPTPLWLVLPKASTPAQLRYELAAEPRATAPLAAGALIGHLRVYDGSQLLATRAVVSAHAIDRSTWWARAWFTL